jgi:DNA-binding beta-propeller fold protein YncE
MLKSLLLTIATLAIANAQAPAPGGLTRAQERAKAKAQNVPEIPYEAVPGFIKMPKGLYLGEGIGVATNSKGHVFVYTRSQDTRLFEFDQNGNFLKEIGEGLYGFQFAHAVRVDKEDNIWAVDEGTNMVIKFSPQGRVLMVLGRRPESVEGVPVTPGFGGPPPVAQPYEFNRPTDVAWDPAGNIFVSDGYGNSRVVKYSKDGRFISSVGTRGASEGQLNLPHTLAADAKGNIYVGDRSNSRIQVFDNDLKFKAIYDQVGAPWAVCISPGPHQYLYSSNSAPDSNNAELWAVTGEIYKMELDGTILGKFGKSGKGVGEFSTVHEMDCHSENEIYTAEITMWRSQKIVLHPKK